jgi:hypothetical protein
MDWMSCVEEDWIGSPDMRRVGRDPQETPAPAPSPTPRPTPAHRPTPPTHQGAAPELRQLDTRDLRPQLENLHVHPDPDL